MLSDRELLERAAKAAGIPLKLDFAERFDYYMSDSLMWNPLTNDGDALRLAVKLGIAVIPYPMFAHPKHSVIAKRYEHARYLRGESNDINIEEITVYGDDPCAATCRAIVCAAAKIGADHAE